MHEIAIETFQKIKRRRKENIDEIFIWVFLKDKFILFDMKTQINKFDEIYTEKHKKLVDVKDVDTHFIFVLNKYPNGKKMFKVFSWLYELFLW